MQKKWPSFHEISNPKPHVVYRFKFNSKHPSNHVITYVLSKKSRKAQLVHVNKPKTSLQFHALDIFSSKQEHHRLADSSSKYTNRRNATYTKVVIPAKEFDNGIIFLSLREGKKTRAEERNKDGMEITRRGEGFPIGEFSSISWKQN